LQLFKLSILAAKNNMKIKSILYTISITLFSLVVQAQAPVLDSTVCIAVGNLAQINVISNALSIPFGNAGAAQTYDYAMLPSFNSNYEILGVDNLTSPFGTQFPTANATVSWSSFGTPYYHFQLSNTAYTFLGGGSSFTSFHLLDTYDQLRFPFTYNDAYIDSFFAVSNAGAYRAGTVTITGEGFGTLLVPNQTFTDVLRVKRDQDYYDTINGNPRHSVETYYEYYKPGIPHYILLHGFYTITTGTSSPISGSQLFLNSAALVTAAQPRNLEKSNYYIVHDGNNAVLRTQAQKAYQTNMCLYNMHGNLLAKENLNINTEINGKVLQYPNLSAGMYLIQFQNEQGELVNLKWNKL